MENVFTATSWFTKAAAEKWGTTTLPPAPESIIHLTVCHCKTKCVTVWCKCRKNGLKCSEMCHCLECENDRSD